MSQKLVHISWLKRDGGSLGGVEKFAWLLREYAVPEMTILAVTDFPDLIARDDLNTSQMVKKMNALALEQGFVDEHTIVVCDGFWGMGLEGEVKRLISVAHGTWLGNAISNERISWENPERLLALAAIQHAFWEDERVEIIAVCKQAVREVELGTGRQVAVILNAVDTHIFTQSDVGYQIGLILHIADRPSKGSDIVEALSKEMSDLTFEYLGVNSGKLEDEAAAWRRGAVALFPSRYEGCPYAWLEAMACGLPIVVYKEGLGVDLPPICGEVVDDYYPSAFFEGVNKAYVSREQYQGRQWVEEHADIERWAKRWREVLGQ